MSDSHCDPESANRVDPRNTQQLHNKIIQLSVAGYMSSGETKTPSVTLAKNLMSDDMRRQDRNIDAILAIGPVRGPPPHGSDPLTDMYVMMSKFEAMVIP